MHKFPFKTTLYFITSTIMEIIYVDFWISMFPGRCYGTTLQHKKIIRAEISLIKYIEQGVFRIERITFSRYYAVNLEKCEIVFVLRFVG